jgi:hypothetical protein
MNEMRPPRAKARGDNIEANARRYDRVALVLQGGGPTRGSRLRAKNHFRTANRAHFA